MSCGLAMRRRFVPVRYGAEERPARRSADFEAAGGRGFHGFWTPSSEEKDFAAVLLIHRYKLVLIRAQVKNEVAAPGDESGGD